MLGRAQHQPVASQRYAGLAAKQRRDCAFLLHQALAIHLGSNQLVGDDPVLLHPPFPAHAIAADIGTKPVRLEIHTCIGRDRTRAVDRGKGPFGPAQIRNRARKRGAGGEEGQGEEQGFGVHDGVMPLPGLSGNERVPLPQAGGVRGG